MKITSMLNKLLPSLGMGLGIGLMLASCGGPSIPQNAKETGELPGIYPDYIDVTIPVNIAPLTFHIDNAGDEYVCSYTKGDKQIVTGGADAVPGLDEWRDLTAGGGDITVDVYIRNGETWCHAKPFKIHVVEDEIDPYLTYRLIQPSYVAFEDLTINQRDITSWDEREVYNTRLTSTEHDGQCINCHSFQNYDGATMQFHARASLGGTIIIRDGKGIKMNLKTDSTISAGVYPSWHPTLPLIAYSTNKTGQTFHTRDWQKVEVQDTKSDILLYDVERQEVHRIPGGKDDLECFPWWAPDGKQLYYCSAHYVFRDTSNLDFDMMQRYQEVKYDILRRDFDAKTLAFSAPDTVFSASSDSLSATLPRISPDGRYLLVTLAGFGVFHIWHKDADLYLIDLKSGEGRKLDNANSTDTESYHSWSSNGRWIVVSSRREDGNYTRPFFAYFDKEGHDHKAFALPQRDPQLHRQLLRSYNIPEFTKTPVVLTPQQIAEIVKTDAVPAKLAK